MLARAALVDSDGSVAARLARRSAHGRRSALTTRPPRSAGVEPAGTHGSAACSASAVA